MFEIIWRIPAPDLTKPGSYMHPSKPVIAAILLLFLCINAVAQDKTTLPAAQAVPKPAADTPHSLSFEEVAGNLSKEEFEKKALQKTNQLNIYLKVICDKAANYEEINKAIDQSIGLFVDENAMIETSSVNRNDVKRYRIRSYLSHIKLVNYDKIEIEWTNVQYVSDVKQAPDGNYYGVVSFEQVFRGYRDGKLIYQDVTRKNATVVLIRGGVIISSVNYFFTTF